MQVRKKNHRKERKADYLVTWSRLRFDPIQTNWERMRKRRTFGSCSGQTLTDTLETVQARFWDFRFNYVISWQAKNKHGKSKKRVTMTEIKEIHLNCSRWWTDEDVRICRREQRNSPITDDGEKVPSCSFFFFGFRYVGFGLQLVFVGDFLGTTNLIKFWSKSFRKVVLFLGCASWMGISSEFRCGFFFLLTRRKAFAKI